MFLSIGDVLDTLPETVESTHSTILVEEDMIHVCVIKMLDGTYDVWNIHPLRKGWQKVYTLEHCNPEEQVVQSLSALKRLFEN